MKTWRPAAIDHLKIQENQPFWKQNIKKHELNCQIGLTQLVT